ncbi:MAG TPA: delta-60 repeat domain-containing protein, partial [Pirellulaceae bacterium]|nr:delta-60 repeat domain-containing protein [Pirellulaceae bacterium]
MPFATASSKRKSDRKKARKSRIRQSKRAYLFESLEERLNLSLMFMEMEPNEDTTSPVNFAGDLLAAQAIALPGASTGIVDSATMAQVIGDSPTDNDENPDYYTFNAAVNGEIHITVMNRGGDPGGDGGADNLDVRVFRENPVNVDDAINLPNALANTLPVGKFYTGTFSATAGEKFFVRVSGDAGDDDANYELRIWNSEASDNVVPNNNSQLNAEPLGIVDGTTAIATSGTITQADRDFYRFGAGADGRVSVRITMPEGTGYTFGPEGKEPTNLGVRVRDASGMIIATSNGTAGNVDIASFEATDTNTYFAEIYSSSFGQINAYDLDISMVGDPTGRITGYVFQDDNLNTFRDPTEDLLDGYNVSIDIGNDGATTVDTTLTTDANGYYSFENVPFGTHRVYITPQSGFHAEYPDEPNRAEYTIQISEDNLNMDHTDFALGEADFGDAPDTYGTFLASDGARHANRGPALGKFRDAESNARTPLDGTGDDIGINSAVDLSFNPGAGTNGRVDFVALQADGKALIGGTFTTVDGVSRNNIARLNPDGSLDNTFTPGTGTNGPVLSVALQADGRILIAGDFTAVNGVLRNDIARLNSDGSVDTTFNPGSGTNGSIA